MVYLEHSGSKFWKINQTRPRTVIIVYGTCGNTGRTIKKIFKNSHEAQEYVSTQETNKRNLGYVDATDPQEIIKACKRKPTKYTYSYMKKSSSSPSSSPSPPSSSPPTPTTPTSSPTKKTAGLKHHAAPDLSSDFDGTAVDSGVAGVDAALSSRVVVHETLHAHLALVDPSNNTDKYYILQVLVDNGTTTKKKLKKDNNKKGGSSSTTAADKVKYYLFTRWGRTGTGGQCNLQGPYDNKSAGIGGEGEDDAKSAFCKIFKSKTGVDFSKAVQGAEPNPGKYEYLLESTTSSSSSSKTNEPENTSWYYYLTNDLDGKPDGWYEYDTSNAASVEKLYRQYVASKHVKRLATRFIHSLSSGFTYKVDLSDLTQSNTSTGKTRPIQRTTTGKPPPTYRILS